MFKKFGLLVAGLGASYVFAASAVVFTDEAGVMVTKEPAYAYTYDYGTGASVDSTNVNGAVVLDFTAPTTTDGKSGAGYGFAWLEKGVTSLSGYKGVCLTYSAQATFRMDFKQSTITDDDFFGKNILASANPKKTYIAFADLKQQGFGAKKTWSLSSHEGVQFSYKDTYAKSSKLANNEVILHSFILADECVTAAPNVTEGFKGYNGGAIDLDEGAVHTMDMSEVFEDADGDDLVITVKIESESNSVKLVDSTAFNQNSVIRFTTVPNPDGPATVTLTATDPTKKTATFSFTINTKDTENLPVAKDMAFEVPEDSSYKSGLTAKGNGLKYMGSDPDGDAVSFKLVSEPEHGTLTINEALGQFTYVPEKNFFGTDKFTYVYFETENPERVSEIATATITVTPVNDVPKVTVVAKTFLDEEGEEYAFGDTLVVDEDFASFFVLVPAENITIDDPDGEEDIVISAKASGIVSATYAAMTGFYGIEISAIKDANGVAKITLNAGDHKISVPTVICYVKVNPVADAPIAKEDSYSAVSGALLTVDAKNGILANDVNPDGKSKLTIVIEAETSSGELTVNEDGSFTYKSETGFVGEDAFAYKVVNEDGLESELVLVILDVVKAPVVVEGVMDTVGTRLAALVEDFTVAKRYTKAEVLTWFVDDDDAAEDLVYSVRSDDSLLVPTIASGAITIKAVKDACGDAEVIVSAKNKKGVAGEMRIPATIQCVNDKPVVNNDTVYIDAESDFVAKFNIYDFVYDPDGDSLTFSPTSNTLYDVEVVDDSIVISSVPGAKYNVGDFTLLAVKVSDGTLATTLVLTVKIGKDPSSSIKPMLATPKSTWQNAILANRGVAAMFDMQGRVMWKQKLPVSEAEVRAAASSVQGRKILMVNKQAFTIR